MTTPPSNIFALHLSQPAKPPLAQLIEELKRFSPPPKPLALVAAEAEYRAAREAKAHAQAALDELYRQARAAEQGSRSLPPPRGEIARAEARVVAAETARNLKRKGVEAAASPWRRNYAAALDEAALPVRDGLHDLIGELDDAMLLFAKLATEAARNKLDGGWLLRNAQPILNDLRRVKSYLELDKRV